MASPEVQGSDAAPIGVKLDGRYYAAASFTPHPDWEDEYLEVMPRSMADKLACALEGFYVEQRADSAAWFLEAKRVLAEYREHYPAKETME